MQCCYDDRPAATLLHDHRNILKSNLALILLFQDRHNNAFRHLLAEAMKYQLWA